VGLLRSCTCSSWERCVAVCCSVLQCAAVCCSVLQCAAVCCSALQCVAVCCCVLQCDSACCSGALEKLYHRLVMRKVCCSVLQCIAVCCNVIQRVAVGLLRSCTYSVRTLITLTMSNNTRLWYGVATTSRLLKTIGLVCKRAL